MNQSDLDTSDTSINRSMMLVVIVYGFTLSSYFAWFLIINKGTLASDSAYWGQFGDFVGGFLNPLIAFSALYWLTRSVKLQKTELKETRKALEESADSQARHAFAAEKAMKIAGYAAILNAAVVDIQSNQQYSTSLLERASTHQAGFAMLRNGEMVNREGVLEELKKIGLQINENNTKKRKAEEALRFELPFPNV